MRSISLSRELSIESHRYAQCVMCVGGAARVEEIGELGHWSWEQPSPGFTAARRRKGAIGKAFTESVPLHAEGDVRLAVEINGGRLVIAGRESHNAPVRGSWRWEEFADSGGSQEGDG